MSQSFVFSVRLNKDLKKKIDQLSSVMERPRSWVVSKAIEDYVVNQSWQIEEIQKAVDQSDSGGPFIEHKKIDQCLSSWGKKQKLKKP